VTAYEDGLKIDANNGQLKEGLDLVQKDMAGGGAGANNAFAQLFGAGMWPKLEANPQTKKWLDSDPSVC
jgi:hypothetical protein